MTRKIVALAGDGIGPEIMEAGLAVLEALASKTGFDYEIDRRPFGGAGIDAVTDGIDAQARVLVTVENRDTETIFNAAGLDFDVLKASAIAYINANTFVQKENAGEMGRSVSYRDMPSV